MRVVIKIGNEAGSQMGGTTWVYLLGHHPTEVFARKILAHRINFWPFGKAVVLGSTRKSRNGSRKR